jgi:cell wall assembly regulator SMI1
LAGHAPATAAQVRGPADPADVDAVERDVGTALPAVLRAWWALTDGFEPYALGALIPGIHVPLPAAEVRRQYHSLLAVSASVTWPDTYGEDAMAGTYSHRYQETFVPISADGCGQVLFVDLRPGPWNSCVAQWDHEQGSLDPPRWRARVWATVDGAGELEWNGRPP